MSYNYRKPYENELWHSGHYESRQPYLNELYHYGILGMKWGVRRFQNSDGSLTEAGKKHYGSADTSKGGKKYKEPFAYTAGSRKRAAIKAIENGAEEYKEPVDKIAAVTQDCYPFSANYSYAEAQYIKPGMKDRAREAADLSLQVLANRHFVDQSDVGDNDMRWWVLYEDQTFGYGMVADMINRGYTAKQVSKMIDVVEKNYDYSMDNALESINDRAAYAVFDITQGNYQDELKTFAKECEDIKNSKS